MPCRLKRFFRSCLCWLSSVCMTSAAPALAHSPLFPKSNNSPQAALIIADPLKSWAVYSELQEAGTAAYYRMPFGAGERIRFILFTPQDPRQTGFVPSLRILGPVAADAAGPGFFMDVMMEREGRAPERASYEPFTATWFYRVAEVDTAAPEAGFYYLEILDREKGAGRYGLAVGYKELWTPTELVLLPASIIRIYLWEGQSIVSVLLPVAVVCLAGVFALRRRSARGKPPHSLSQWLAAFSGLFFLGSAVSLACQMVLAMRHTGVTGQTFITVIMFLIPALLALFDFRFALRLRERTGFGRRVGLFVIGILGLVLWSGLFLGPGLALAAAFVNRSPRAVRL